MKFRDFISSSIITPNDCLMYILTNKKSFENVKE